MGILGIIPARYGSTRLPGKPMIKVKGKTIIQRVYERVARSTLLSQAIVATDDVRIYNHVTKFGGEAIMTNQQHRSGTSRCGEVIRQIADARIILNIQGDEPLINPGEIDRLARFMAEDASRKIGTMVKRLDRFEDLEDPSVAKVVLDQAFRALYFSRSPIPHVRNHPVEQWLDHATFYKHIGMYQKRGYHVRRGHNTTGRGNKNVISLDPRISDVTNKFVSDLASALGWQLSSPSGHDVVSDTAPYTVLGHHHVSANKWDIAPWWDTIFGGGALS